MKKKKITITIIILIIIAIAGIIGYKMFFNSIGTEEKAEIDKEIGQIAEEILREIKEAREKGLTGQIGNELNNGQSQLANTHEDADRGDNTSTDVAKILALYDRGFSRLEGQGNAMVERLLSGLKADYSAISGTGSKKAKMAKLASSYSSRAKAMESSMDSSVNVLLAQMKDDLKAEGLSDAEIKANMDRYRSEYKQRKETRRNVVMEKAKGFL